MSRSALLYINYLFMLVWRCLYATFALKVLFSECRALHLHQLLFFQPFKDILPLSSDFYSYCSEISLKFYCFSFEVKVFFPPLSVFNIYFLQLFDCDMLKYDFLWVPLKFICWTLIPQDDGIWRWDLSEVTGLWEWSPNEWD